MLTNLAKILHAEKGEEQPVLLLFGQGFLMGIYIYSYKIVAEALFLSRLETYLAEAMFVSAALGVISAIFFSYLQNRISFSKLTFLNLIIIFVFLGSIRLLYDVLDDKSIHVLVFVSFIMIQPIMSITLLNFWGIFGRIFDLRQSKRIVGGIDSGQLLAAFLTSLSIPFFAKFIVEIDFLFISLAAILLNMVLLSFIISKYDLEKHREEGERSKVSTKISGIMKEKYVFYLSIFLLLSIISFQFVHYSFLSVTKMYYPTETQLVSFLGYFSACIMILSLLLQTFVNERLIAMYGLKTTLLVLPIVLGVFTIVTIWVGSFFGYAAHSPAFIWFFLFISLSKLFSESLRESLETPSFKLFFMPLDIKIRFDIQAKVEGVINEFSRLIAGFIILVLGFLAFFKLIHYSVILVVVIIAWIWSTSKLYAEYRNNVKKKLQGQKADYEIKQKKQRQIKNIINDLEKDTVSGNIIFSLKLLEKWDLNLFRAYVNKLTTTSNKHVRKFALDIVNELRTTTPVNNRIFNLQKNNGSNFSLAKWFDSIGSDRNIDHHDLTLLLKSENKEDRKYLASILSRRAGHHGSSILMELLHDLDNSVKSAAIKSAASVRNKESFPILIEELKSPKFTDKAMDAFVEIGEEAFPALETAFYKSGQNIKIMLKILQIYGKVGGARAIGLLWEKIDYPDKKIIAQVLHSLGECDFLANESQVRRIKFAIDSDLANIAWNLKALESIPEGIGADLLKEAVEADIISSVKHIFMLLTMLYDTHSIQLVQENLFGKSGEGLTYAIELLDVFLSDDIKEKIIFMLDDVLESKELKKLQNYYPQRDLKFTETVRMVINRDYSLNNRWTKACAIHFIGENNITGYNMDLIANLFNPDLLIREISAWSMYQNDPSSYHLHINRLDIGSKKELESMINNNGSVKSRKMLRFEKIRLLGQIELFKYIPAFILSNVVEMSQDLYLEKGKEIHLDHENLEFIYALNQGRLELSHENGVKKIEEGKKLVGSFIELGDYLTIKALADSFLIKIEKEKFYDYMSSHMELVLHVLENVNKDLKTKQENEEALT
jgi:ATP:ADP antiporter, AAA family